VRVSAKRQKSPLVLSPEEVILGLAQLEFAGMAVKLMTAVSASAMNAMLVERFIVSFLLPLKRGF
jgi:hypothetical protein